MEKSKATSEFVYEDEYSYITEEGEIYRKRNKHQTEKKVGQADLKDIESVVAEYQDNFAYVEQQIQDLDANITREQAQEWMNKLHQADAIGDFDPLYKWLDDLTKVDSGQPEEEDDIKNGGNEEEATHSKEVAGNNQPQQADESINPIDYYKDLTKKAREAAQSEDWNRASQKLDQLSHEWSDGPEINDEDDKDKVRNLYAKFTNAEANFQKHKEKFYARADKSRIKNLSKKQDLIHDIENIVESGKWSATGPINRLQSKWHSIGEIPKDHASDLNKKYRSLIKEFKSHKVDRLVEKRQKREDNLMMKMAVLDKMEKVADSMDHDTTNWKEIDDKFDDLTSQWKKIGRVPREKSNKVWSRYKAAQDTYYDNKYKYHIDHRSNVDSFTAKKGNIIKATEELVEKDDIAKAARKVNRLHRRWKKIGNLPQRKEDELWDQFKAATDAFNEKKSNNRDRIQQQEEEHYQQKLKLIEKADEVKETNNWDKGHQQMQSYMDRWKKIGPVPRKKSGKIWRQFKGAMDIFYDRRREHFAEAKEKQKENLESKKALLEQLRELGQHPDPIEAVNEAKKLQSEFKDVGYVPIKKKNEMWKQYREVCDVIYDRMRAAKSGNKFDQELAKADLKPKDRSKIQDLRKQHKNLEKKVRDLKKEVIQFEESKANFNFSDEDNPLLQDMEQKIAKAKARLESKKNKLESLSMEMDDIRREA